MLRLTKFEFDQLTTRRASTKRKPQLNRPRAGKKWEDMFAQQLDDAGIVGYEREYRFRPDRRFRLDFAFPQWTLAVEVDGAVHRIKERFNADRERGQVAMLHGWRVLHVSPKEVRSGHAITLTKKLLLIAGAIGELQT